MGLRSAMYGINENLESTYNEEQNLFEVKHDVKQLISGLESRENEDET